MNVLSRRLDKAEAVLAEQYGNLTAEERFRLVVAAAARGDDVERQRLFNASRRIALGMPDFAPFSDAFNELSLLTFVELLADASDYLEIFHRADDAQADAEAGGAGEAQGNEDDDDHEDAAAAAEVERVFDMALAAGYMLKARADGWALFCERRSLPPFACWEDLPGYARLRRALKVAEQAAFQPAGMVAWLNRTRPEGQPKLTEVGLTPEVIAAGLDRMFREQAAFWGGTAATKPECGLAAITPDFAR